MMSTDARGTRRLVLLRMTLLMSLAMCTVSAGASVADVPGGWIRAGSAPTDYAWGVDRHVAHAGGASGYLKSRVAKPSGFGTLMQMFDARSFHGKRVRMSAWVKSDQISGWAGLWMRVDGTEPNRMLAFDNMQSRPIQGTSGWKPYSVVLDVASDAKDIAFGILLDGTGTVWLDDVRFEIVDRSVPTTGGAPGGELAAQPGNLDFESK